MATGSWPTIADVTSRSIGPESKQAYIAEMMSQSIVMLKDMPFVEANEMGGHEFVFRTSIPAGAWRSVNQGIGYSKSTTGKSRVGIGSLEGYSQIDRWLAEQSGDITRFRESEDVAFMEGMGQTMEQTVWYGNTTVLPSQFMGLAPFYNTVNPATAQNAANVIDGGGVANANCSMWLIAWSPRTIYGLYPRASKAGLEMVDKGDVVPGYDSLGNPFEAYTAWFRHQMSLCPQDWRFAVRLANLDTTTAGLAGPNAPDLFTLMSKMVLSTPQLTNESSGITETDAPEDPAPGQRPVFYANRTLRFYMDQQGMRNRNVLLTLNDAAGKPQDIFRGIPVKVSDQLLNTESRLV